MVGKGGFWPFRRRAAAADTSAAAFQKPLGKLEGKVALITGAGSGLGRASALAFFAAGGRGIVVDRDLNSARPVTKDIENGGGSSIALEAHVSHTEDVQRAITTTIK